jgi:uncharacterized membrane protein
VALVMILGAIGSIPLVILTPPFQVPDEMRHFYRAYQLSEFQVRAEVQNGVAGGTLPDSLEQLVNSSVTTTDGISYLATPAPIANTLKLASIPLNPSQRRFVAFPGSAFYSPLPYLPPVLAIDVGRAIGLQPLYLLYLGRLFNCLAAVALLGLAVSFMPFAEELIILVGLLPMSLYLYASLSADAAVIACALVFTAVSFSASARGSWGKWELCIAAVAGAVFCSVKPVYAPMLLAAVAPGAVRSGNAARMIRSQAILLVIALGAAAGWLLVAKSTMTTPLSGAHPLNQLNLIWRHPMLLVHVFAHTLSYSWLLTLYLESVGVFGWLTVLLRPGMVYVLPLISLLLLWWLGVRDPLEHRRTRRALWYVMLALASAVLVVVALYLMWEHVGQDSDLVVQGRYFIPIFGLAGMAAIELLPQRPVSAPRWQRLASIAAIVVVEIAAMDSTIIRSFHIF